METCWESELHGYSEKFSVTGSGTNWDVLIILLLHRMTSVSFEIYLYMLVYGINRQNCS